MTAPETAGVILVVEEAPEWAPELARQFPAAEVRSVTAAAWGPSRVDGGADAPRLVVLNGAGIVEALARWSGIAASTAVIAILPAAAAGPEPLLRELGVTSVWTDGDDRERVLAACRRLFSA